MYNWNCPDCDETVATTVANYLPEILRVCPYCKINVRLNPIQINIRCFICGESTDKNSMGMNICKKHRCIFTLIIQDKPVQCDLQVIQKEGKFCVAHRNGKNTLCEHSYAGFWRCKSFGYYYHKNHVYCREHYEEVSQYGLPF
jgi:hypothetical protein